MFNEHEEEAEDRLSRLITEHFRYLHWDDDDIELAAMWIRTMSVGLHILSIPVTHKKFPETLRCMANILEVIISEKSAKSRK